MKVKIFQSWLPEVLEKTINEWLAKNPQLNTIKIESLNSPISQSGFQEHSTLTVIIWYKE